MMARHRQRSWSRRGCLTATMSATVMGLAAAACSRTQSKKTPSERRIVTLGGTLTEIVFALGLGESVVGVDTSSVYPLAATALAQVGYHRHVSAEGIISLGPTLVIHSDVAGPPSAFEQLSAAGIETLTIPEPKDLDGARARIVALAKALGRGPQATPILQRFDAEIAAARRLSASTKHRPRVLFLYARGADTLLVSGHTTAADLMVREAGGQNCITAFEGFRPLSAESVIAAAPEVIVVPERSLESIGGLEGLRDQPGLNETPAARSGRLVALDDLALLGLGPRTGQALNQLTRALHPELDA